MGEILLWFLVGCIVVNMVIHAPGFVTASNSSFGFVNNMMASITSKKA